MLLEPLLALLPPSLLVKCLSDLGVIVGREDSKGLRFKDVHSYCTLKASCNPTFSIASAWAWFMGLYVLYSVMGLYLENVRPDQLGAKKHPFYFLTFRYWGLGHAQVPDVLPGGRTRDGDMDIDVAAEECNVQRRANLPMDEGSAIEVFAPP